MLWYWGGSGMHWWGWLFVTLVTVAFWGLVFWGIVFVARLFLHGGPPESGPDSPERILARRFAEGEIDEEEFNRRLDALRNRARQP